jgi:hypothetical protein
VKWRYDPGSSGTVSAKPWSRIGRNGKYAYQAGTWGNLNLFDVETGKKLWEFAGVSGGGSWTPVQVVATPNLEYLLAGNFSDVFYLLTSDGRCVSHRPDLASYLNGLAVSDNARTLVTWTTWLHWNGDFGFERHQIWQNEVAAMERTPATPEPPIWTQGDYAEAEGGAP